MKPTRENLLSLDVGDKLLMTIVSRQWTCPHVVVAEPRECDEGIVIELESNSKTPYRLTKPDGGRPELTNVANRRYHSGDVTKVVRDGRVSPAKQLELLDGRRELPDGDDSWKRYQEVA